MKRKFICVCTAFFIFISALPILSFAFDDAAKNFYIKNIDKYVHIDFLTHFEVSAKTKVLDIEGYLRKFENNVLEIEYNNKGQIKKLLVDKQQIKLIRLAIKF
jgi:hypothetical protein